MKITLWIAIAVGIALLQCGTSLAQLSPNTSFQRSANGAPPIGLPDSFGDINVSAISSTSLDFRFPFDTAIFIPNDGDVFSASLQGEIFESTVLASLASSKLLPPSGVTGFAPCVSASTFGFVSDPETVFGNNRSVNQNARAADSFTTRPGFGGPVTTTNQFATMNIVMHVLVSTSPIGFLENIEDSNSVVDATNDFNETIVVGQARLTVTDNGEEYCVTAFLPDSSEADPFAVGRNISVCFPREAGLNLLFTTTQLIRLNGDNIPFGARTASFASISGAGEPGDGVATASVNTSSNAFFFGRDNFLTDATGPGMPVPGSMPTGGTGGGGPRPRFGGVGSDSSNSVGTGNAIGVGFRDDVPLQAVKELGFATATYEENLQGFTPSVSIVAEGPPASTTLVSFGDVGTTYVPETGVAEFDLSSYGPFEPGYYTYRFAGGEPQSFYVAFPGDVNLDGVVDGDDVAIVERSLETPEAFTIANWTDGDVDCDGAITPLDLELVQTLREPEVLLGDVNRDDTVNFLDISPFISRLTTGTFQAEADVNQDGVVSFLDISSFIVLLSS